MTEDKNKQSERAENTLESFVLVLVTPCSHLTVAARNEKTGP